MIYRKNILFFILWSAVFVVMFSMPVSYYPEKWAFDALKISGDIAYYDITGSFEATRKVLYFGGQWSANVITFTVFIGWIYVISMYIDNLYKFIVSSLFLIPLILLNALWPAKETIVMLIALLVVLLWIKYNLNLILMICILYIIYGVFFRTYYLLILLVFFIFNAKNYLILMNKTHIDSMGTIATSKELRLFFKVLIVLVFVFALPESFYVSSQGQRDVSNAYAILEGSLNKTAFNNIADVGRGSGFLANYAWSALNLFFPFVNGLSLNQLLLFAFNIASFYGIYRLVRLRISNIFIQLYCSHVLVLLLFEPDQGSYFRHILSVSIYLIPLLGLNQVFYKERKNK